MTQPKGLWNGEKHLVCKLKKKIYSLKQSPRCWNATPDSHLKDMGFTPHVSHGCRRRYLLSRSTRKWYCSGWTYRQSNARGEGCSLLQFNIKDMGKLHHFLGMTVVQDKNKKSVWIGQPAYAENLLRKFRMQDCKPVGTPVDISTKLIATEADVRVAQQQHQLATEA